MSRIDFSAFKTEQPALAPTWDALAHWFREHKKVRLIDTRRLGSEVAGVRPTDLAVAITILVNRGLFEQVYGVVAPSTRTLVDQLFRTPTEIPERLRDRFAHEFNTDDAEVVPLLREASK